MDLLEGRLWQNFKRVSVSIQLILLKNCPPSALQMDPVPGTEKKKKMSAPQCSQTVTLCFKKPPSQDRVWPTLPDSSKYFVVICARTVWHESFAVLNGEEKQKQHHITLVVESRCWYFTTCSLPCKWVLRKVPPSHHFLDGNHSPKHCDGSCLSTTNVPSPCIPQRLRGWLPPALAPETWWPLVAAGTGLQDLQTSLCK